MTTLILPARYSPDSIALWQAAIAEGWTVQRLPHWRIDAITPDQFVIYGEYLFARVIAKQLSLALLQPAFDWLTQIPFGYLKRKIQFAELAAIESFPLPAFIKPADDKCFKAQVYEAPNALPSVGLLPAQTPILIAEPVTWHSEFRCFILNRNVTTISLYARNGVLASAEASESELGEALAFAQAVLEESALIFPPSIVFDIGYIQERGWAIVEANPAWSSGIYECDPRQVLYTIARGCPPLADVTDDDKQWVISPIDE